MADVQYLDPKAAADFKARLPKDFATDWEALEAWLANAGPEVRARVVGLCMDLDLEVGRKAYQLAHVAEERFKTDLIRKHGPEVRSRAGRLGESMGKALEALDRWRAVGRHALRVVQQAESDFMMFKLCRAGFLRVSGSWDDCYEGAARGKGVTGYDTPEGVKKAREQAEAAQRRRHGQAKTDEAVSNTAKAEAERLRYEEAQRLELEAQAFTDEARKRKIAAHAGTLFGGGE